jgi:serine/threonine-protein kinase
MSLELDLPIRQETPKPSKRKEIVEEEVTREITREISKSENKEKIKKPKRKFRKVALILAVAVGIGGWWSLIGPGARVTVPSLVGGTMSDAENLLKPIGLTSEVSKEEFSEDLQKGIIISTSPSGGDKVKEGAIVLITLSKGPERYSIPMVAQLTVEAAIKVLSSIPIAEPVVQQIFSEKIPKGYVISSEPVMGTKVKRGAGIKLVVSKGIEQIPLINQVKKR